jgi:hypothetical protein|tara:strand:- start:2338 stop:2838 length:501 start_codon:yes stop_codon:yes gene_type:complete
MKKSHEVDLKKDLGLSKKNFRTQIMALENKIKNVDHKDVIIGDSDVCPLKHSFSDGIYVREITIPAGMLIIGKIHKHDHPNFLLKGEVVVVTEEGGVEELKAPCSMISKPGTKRALYAKTELVWTTVHLNPTNTQDLEELEEEIIAPTYEAYEKFLETYNTKQLNE